MHQLNDLIQWRVIKGKPVTMHGKTMTPQAQSITFRWPNGGWVWNRPTSVLVESDGHIQHLPIVDVTRIIQLILFGLAFSLSLLTLSQFLRLRR
ncbi:MAG: hypothetical protein AAF629_08890 [Chloroflexota bacterium]